MESGPLDDFWTPSMRPSSAPPGPPSYVLYGASTPVKFPLLTDHQQGELPLAPSSENPLREGEYRRLVRATSAPCGTVMGVSLKRKLTLPLRLDRHPRQCPHKLLPSVIAATPLAAAPQSPPSLEPGQPMSEWRQQRMLPMTPLMMRPESKHAERLTAVARLDWDEGEVGAAHHLVSAGLSLRVPVNTAMATSE